MFLDATPEDSISKLIKGRKEFITSRLGMQLDAAGDVIEVRIKRLRHLFKEGSIASTSCLHLRCFLSTGAARRDRRLCWDSVDGVPGDALLARNLVVSRGEREMIRGRGSN